jgi:hypothetical protein
MWVCLIKLPSGYAFSLAYFVTFSVNKTIKGQNACPKNWKYGGGGGKQPFQYWPGETE